MPHNPHRNAAADRFSADGGIIRTNRGTNGRQARRRSLIVLRETRRKTMNSGVILGWVGGIIGFLLGFAGAIIGIRCGTKNTCGPRERVFLIRMTVVLVIALVAVTVLPWFLPKANGWVIFIPLTLLLVFGIPYCNRTQRRIRQEEAQNKPPEGAR
jgi:hypothetical protein